jgi:Golgi apparatus protein 1
MEVENYKNDIILAEACREDVDKYCANVEPGQYWLVDLSNCMSG